MDIVEGAVISIGTGLGVGVTLGGSTVRFGGVIGTTGAGVGV